MTMVKDGDLDRQKTGTTLPKEHRNEFHRWIVIQLGLPDSGNDQKTVVSFKRVQG